MVLSNKTIENLLFGLFIGLIPFQDTIMRQSVLGYPGYYLSTIPLCLLIIYRLFNGNVFHVDKKYIISFSWIVFISVLMVFLNINNEEFAYMLYKTFSNSLIFILYSFAIYFVYESEDTTLKKSILIAFIIHVSGVIISDYFLFNDGYIIHASDGEYGRLRGFCAESSWFAYTLVILGFLLVRSLNNKIATLLVASITFFLVLISGSKGSAICMVITVLMLCFYIKNKLHKLIIFSIFLLIVIEYYSIISMQLVSDIESYTSFSTRASSIVSSILIMFQYPFGTGFGVFTHVYKETLMNALYILEIITGFHLNSKEIELYIFAEANQMGVAVKSIYFQWIAYFGFPFLYVSIKFLSKVYHKILKTNNSINIFLLLFFLIANLTYATFMYESCLLLGFFLKDINHDTHLQKGGSVYENRN